MRSCHLLRIALVAGSLAAALPASAQSNFDPATGTVCGLINFAFCPQGVPPAALPDPEGDVERAARPRPIPAAEAPAVRRKRKAPRTVPRATDDGQ